VVLVDAAQIVAGNAAAVAVAAVDVRNVGAAAAGDYGVLVHGRAGAAVVVKAAVDGLGS
jgi:hypothetical protein